LRFNLSGTAFIYIEQCQLNVPTFLQGNIKRRDHLVGILLAGILENTAPGPAMAKLRGIQFGR
jgi:hypothetical protein